MRSMSPNRPVTDTELHAFSTVNWRDPNLTASYTSTALWLAHTHGLALNQVWYWGRNAWSPEPSLPKEFGGADFAMSILSQPICLNAYARTHIQLNSIADHVIRIAREPKALWILYSTISSYPSSHRYEYLNTQLATYSLIAQLGSQVGFTEDPSSLQDGDILFIPRVLYASNSTVEAVRTLVEHKVKVVVVQNSTSHTTPFYYQDNGQPRDMDTLQFLNDLPRLDVSVADEVAFLELQKITPNSAGAIKCSAVGAASSFGLHCRSADGVVVVTNLINEPLRVQLDVEVSEAMDLLTGHIVELPLTLQPLDTFVLKI